MKDLTWLFNFGMKTNAEEGKPAKLCLRNDPVLHLDRVDRLGKYIHRFDIKKDFLNLLNSYDQSDCQDLDFPNLQRSYDLKENQELGVPK